VDNVILNLYVGPPLSGKSQSLMEQMLKIHKLSPTGYLFVGPSGRFVKEMADRFARFVGGTIPRGNFLVIDQLAVHLYNILHPEQIHIEDDLLSVFVADIIAKLPEEELGDLSGVRTSPELIRFTLEAVREAKEEGTEELLDRLEPNPSSARLVSRVLEQLEKRYGGKLFDTFDAYINADPAKLKLLHYIRQRFGTHLFMDGFTNFSRVHMIFLSRLFPIFREIHIALDNVVWNGERWLEFEEMLKKRCVWTGQELVVKRHRFSASAAKSKVLEAFLNNEPSLEVGDFLEVVTYKNPDDELVGLCSTVKQLIVDESVRPGEIAIVLNNFSEKAREFQKKLMEYGIPTRLEGDEPLINSRVVQLLMLPLRTAMYGYPPEMLMSMIDHGVGKKGKFWHDLDETLGVEELERLASAAALYIEPPRSNLRRRKESWLEKLESLRQSLSKKAKLLESEDEYSSTIEEVKKQKEGCEKLIARVTKLFDFLEPLEMARTKKVNIDFYLETLRNWTDEFMQRSDLVQHEELVSEHLALQRFREALDALEITLKAASIERVTLDEFMTFLQTLLQTESYKPSPDFANTVEILTLENARFKHVKYKIFADFVDGVYPAVRHNPLYPLQESGENFNYYHQKAREQEENFYTSLKGCEKVILAIPIATREGEPLTPSFWLRRLLPDGAYMGREEKKVDDPTLLRPMSVKELEIAVNWAYAQKREVKIDDIEGSWSSLLASPARGGSSSLDYRLKRVELLREILPKSISHTRIQDYRNCPFKFFLKYVMGLSEPWDETYDLSPLELGSIYHRVLKSIYEWAEKTGRKLELPLQEERVRELVDDVLEEFASGHRIRGHSVVRNYLKEKITNTIVDYLKVESESDRSYVGTKTLTEKPFRLPLRALEAWLPRTAGKYGDLEIVGRIDRIDLFEEFSGEDRPPVVVSDYKRSGNSASWEQLELYVLALMGLDDSEVPHYADRIHALYRVVEDKGKTRFPKQIDFSLEDGTFERSGASKEKVKKVEEIDQELLRILDGIFESAVFSKGKNCWLCRLAEICRSTQWRFEGEADMGGV